MTSKAGFGSSSLALWLLLGLAACAGLDEKPTAKVDLSGRWLLNDAQSDDPRMLMAAQREQRTPRRNQPFLDARDPVTGLGIPGTAERAGGGPSLSEFRARHDAAMNRLLWLDARQLDIRQSASDLVIASPEASTRYVFGQKSVVSVPNGVADRETGWKDRAFVVETRVPEGVSAEQHYALDPNGRQLIATTELGGDGVHLTVRRVFDRAPP